LSYVNRRIGRIHFDDELKGPLSKASFHH